MRPLGRGWGLLLVVTLIWGCGAARAPVPVASRPAPSAFGAQSADGYPIGAPTLQDIWVDPVAGDDGNDGATRATALRTIRAAWNRIPAGVALSTTGYRLQLVAGDYPEGSFPHYWEARHGTAQFPIILHAVDGPRTARLLGNLNVFDVRYFYLLGLAVVNAGDVFHCEQCRYVLIRDAHLDGGARLAHETVKVNQSQHIYIESSDIHGAGDNPLDFVAVQYGHLLRNRIHDGGDWCAYVKGGSAYLNVEGNEFFNCGTGGFTAGQGTGFEFMTAPWLHYEAYAIRVVNNVIHDTEGAGLGVNGGYQILMAYNTLYRVGARSHLLEAVFGLRSCDGDGPACAARLAQGGWGSAQIGSAGEQPIPNRDVIFANNVILNPADAPSQWQHLAVYAPRTPAAGTNIPAPATTDDHLRFVGNVIWNGPSEHPLGVGEGEGCAASNPTCNVTQLRAANAINTVAPRLVDPAGGDYRLANPEELPAPVAIPAFLAWQSFTPAVDPQPVNPNVPVDRAGQPRAGANLVGAYAREGQAATATPVPPTETPTPVPPTATPVPPADSVRLYLAALRRDSN